MASKKLTCFLDVSYVGVQEFNDLDDVIVAAVGSPAPHNQWFTDRLVRHLEFAFSSRLARLRAIGKLTLLAEAKRLKTTTSDSIRDVYVIVDVTNAPTLAYAAPNGRFVKSLAEAKYFMSAEGAASAARGEYIEPGSDRQLVVRRYGDATDVPAPGEEVVPAAPVLPQSWARIDCEGEPCSSCTTRKSCLRVCVFTADAQLLDYNDVCAECAEKAVRMIGVTADFSEHQARVAKEDE